MGAEPASLANGTALWTRPRSEIKPEDYTEFYYIAAYEAARLAASPQLEGFRARGDEVLLFSDPDYSFWVSSAPDF